MRHFFTRPSGVLWVGFAAVVVAGTLLVAKLVAYLLTGSAAVLSSLVDSGVDTTVSVMTFIALRYSLMPADEDHRFGHGKIEGVSALVQAALIASGAVFLFLAGADRLIHPQPIEATAVGVGVMVLSIILSLVLVKLQSWSVAHHGSLAVEADRGHYATDALSNLATVAVLLVAPLAGWGWLDPLFALLMGGLMVKVAWDIGHKATAMLLDREVEAAIKAEVEAIIRDDPAVAGLHDLRVTRNGMRFLIWFDLELDGDLTLKHAHDIAAAAEDRLVARHPNAEVMIHKDPAGAPAGRHH